MSIVSTALEGCVLRSFSLKVDELGDESIRAFGQQISENARRIEIQTLVYFHRIRSFFHLLKGLRVCSSMTTSQEMMQQRHVQFLLKNEDFKFSSSNIGARGAKVLVGALSEGSRLKMLDLTDNMFGTKGGVALRQVTSRHLGLTEVFFGRMNLKDEG
ncbi:hypothetical protein SUGI_0668610 [Cryptomeria japonica]|nr:hypothetical protein SUGI_0668320 [Cryptomeria japonica]GLJ33226.1 hypothetical protein SUGI_0668610 [Cryptomeria japonica]